LHSVKLQSLGGLVPPDRVITLYVQASSAGLDPKRTVSLRMSRVVY